MSSHLAHRGLAVAAALLVLAALAPSVGALHGTAQPSVVLCGVIQNEAGWSLADVTLEVTGTGVGSVDHLIPAIHTNATGAFRVAILADRYNFLFVDQHPPADRAGATYAARLVQVVGTAFASPACDAPRGGDLGVLALTAPHVGFIEATVVDAAAGSAARVAEATATSVVAAPTPDGLAWGSAASDAAGIAHVTCPLTAPTTVALAKSGFVATTSAGFTCQARNAVGLLLYRAPVAVDGLVSDLHTLAPLEGASVQATPRTFAPVADPANPYALTASADEDGAYHLALPWGDIVDITASDFGYASETRALAPVQDDVGAGLRLDMPLGRLVFHVAGRVTDLVDAGIGGVQLSFIGPAPLEDQALAITAADGTFGADVRVGSYGLTVSKDGLNTNTCTLDLAGDGSGAIPAACLQLLHANMGAVRGRALDGLVGAPLAGIAVSAGPSVITGADGRFAFEVPQGAATLTLSESAYQTFTQPLTVVLDQILEVGDLRLARALSGVVVQARDDGGANVGSAGAAVGGARVCLDLVGPVSTAGMGCENADGAGDATFQLPWTVRSGLLDAGTYRAKGERLGSAPIYESQVCATGLQLAPGGSAILACPLRAVNAIGTPVGAVRDAHTGGLLAGVLVEASAAGVPCAAPYVCTVTTAADGTAALQLPAGRSYAVVASRSGYQAPAALAGVAPGDAVYAGLRLARVGQDVDLTVLDVHTGSAVKAARVDARAAFACDPGFGGFTCADTANAAGAAHLRLPWGTLTLAVAGGDYAVALDGGDESGVAFEPAARALTLAADGAPVTLDPPMRMLRQVGDPIRGDLRDFAGQPAQATLTPTLQRAGFICDPDPATHDGPAARFTGCDARLATGSYTLRLPHGTTGDHLWTLDVAAPGTFRESASDVALGSTVDFTLWPLTFTLTVTPLDASSGATVPDTTVCILDLDQAAQGVPVVPVERCLANGPSGGPVAFDNVTWLRDDLDGAGAVFAPDTGDRFSVRGTQVEHVGGTIQILGPGHADVALAMVPFFPNVDTADSDGDGFFDGLESAVGSDPSDPNSFPLNDGLAYHDANDAHSVFIDAEGAEVLPGGQAALAPAHGAFQFAFSAERYVGLPGVAEPVSAAPGTPVAFALLDASAVARLAGTGVLPSLHDAAFLVLRGTVGDGTFSSPDGFTVHVRIAADALPTAADVVVPWAQIRDGAPHTTLLGTFQAASGFYSLARNQLRGSPAADKLDDTFTPLVLAAASAGCAPHLFDPDPTAVSVDCAADTREGLAGAEVRVPVDLGTGSSGARITVTDGLPTTPLGTHVVGVSASADAATVVASALDSDGDGTATPDEILAGRDPTAPQDDGGIPQAMADRLAAYATQRAADLGTWLGL